MQFYFGVNSDGTAVKVSMMHGPSDYVEATTYYECLSYMVDMLDQHYPNQEPQVSFMFSSSIDFPEDSTDDPAIIALCDFLRDGDLL